jgi:hypothetical protein
MAMAARYGNVQPSEFESMDFDEAQELAKQVRDLAQKEFEAEVEMHVELTKAIIKALSQRMFA